MYSMELTLLVLEAGIKLLRERRPDLLYLSLTDWVQHKWAPDEDGARELLPQARRLRRPPGGAGRDHRAHRRPRHERQEHGRTASRNVLWLQDMLDAKFGKGETTVICPITDAFVAHHGALGGFVRVWSRGKVTARQIIEHIGDATASSWRWTARPSAACSTCRPTARATWR